MSKELVASPFGPRGEGALAETSGARQTQSRELAEVQTLFLMAKQFPRDERKAMDGIINAFSRRGLAERSQYQYSKGGEDITGPSIHAAQAMAQQWGNIKIGWREISRGIGPDGVPFSEVESYAIDLQSSVPSNISFIAPHWRDTKKGGYKLTSDRDIYELCSNQAQRRKRACILSVLPQDVIDAAMEQAELTLKANADTSPEGMKKMLEAFEPFGVSKEMIEKRIQRHLGSISAAQVVMLKRIYASLRDGMSEVSEWFEPEAAAEGAAATTGAAGLKERMSARKPKAEAIPKAKPKADAKPAGTEQKPAAPTANDFIKLLDEAADTEAALEVLAKARNAGMAPDQLKLVEDGFRMAWQAE